LKPTAGKWEPRAEAGKRWSGFLCLPDASAFQLYRNFAFALFLLYSFELQLFPGQKILSATEPSLGGLKNKKNTCDHSSTDRDVCSDTSYQLRRAKHDLKISDRKGERMRWQVFILLVLLITLLNVQVFSSQASEQSIDRATFIVS
jgi:hypothetical protein